MTLSIKKQGVYAAGGTVQQTEGIFDPINGQWAPAGQTRHSDHANVFYQLPEKGNGHALMFLHGYGQSRNGWMSTPDGREGFSDIFLKKGYGVYLVDQPRRASAGQSSVPVEISAQPDDQTWYTQFRMGLWPNLDEKIKFPRDEESMNQFFRQYTPDTGEFDVAVITSALVAALETSGPATLVTHSQGGIPGWFIATASDNVESVVALEPGTFVFPEGEVPEVVESLSPVPVQGIPVPVSEFEKLIKKPISIYFGDNIPSEPSHVPAWDFWRANLELAHKFAEVANAHGGDVKVFHLPAEGITGNEHFMFQDLNNKEIADHIANWMSERGLA